MSNSFENKMRCINRNTQMNESKGAPRPMVSGLAVLQLRHRSRAAPGRGAAPELQRDRSGLESRTELVGVLFVWCGHCPPAPGLCRFWP